MPLQTDAELRSDENVVGLHVCARLSLLIPFFRIKREITMAKICFMREGLTGRADPVAEKPIGWCIEKLGLQMRDWWADRAGQEVDSMNLTAKFA